jgi:excisionase family DNA binding protein
MKKLISSIGLLLLSTNLFCNGFVIVKNSKTDKEFSKADGVKITKITSYTQREAIRESIDPYSGKTEYRKEYLPDMISCHTFSYIYDPDYKFGYGNKGVLDMESKVTCKFDPDEVHKVTVEFIVEASGYVSDRRSVSIDVWSFGDNRPDITFYLVPKKENISLDGNLNVNQHNSNSDELGVISTIDISKILGVDESEVIKLITTNKLKGKKIGNKYFIRKTDFDAYMKQ